MTRSPEFIKYDESILEPSKPLLEEYQKEKLKKKPYQVKLDKLLNQINKINAEYEKYKAMTYEERLKDFRKQQLKFKNSKVYISTFLSGIFVLTYQYYVDGLIKRATTIKHFNQIEKILDDCFIPQFQAENPKIKSTLKLYIDAYNNL